MKIQHNLKDKTKTIQALKYSHSEYASYSPWLFLPCEGLILPEALSIIRQKWSSPVVGWFWSDSLFMPLFWSVEQYTGLDAVACPRLNQFLCLGRCHSHWPGLDHVVTNQGSWPSPVNRNWLGAGHEIQARLYCSFCTSCRREWKQVTVSLLAPLRGGEFVPYIGWG